MAKKRTGYKSTKAKAKHDEKEPAGSDQRHGTTMTQLLVYILPVTAALMVGLAGILYNSQKIVSIWLMFGAVVLSALAACLYWQDAVIVGAENPPFAVAIETAWNGQVRDATQLFCEYNRKFLSPVPIALYVRVVNKQDVPSDISQFKIEVEQKRPWIFPSSWVQTVEVPDYMPLIWMNPPPTLPRPLTLLGPRLRPILEGKPLQPHQTVRGWVLLDAPRTFDSTRTPKVFRISLKDTAGRRLTKIDSGPTGEENVFPDHGFSFEVGSIDINGFEIRHLADRPN